MAQQITCITKRGDHYGEHERIQRIGGDGPPSWRRSEDDAIADVRLDSAAYFVLERGVRVGVKIATHNARPYLKTDSDRYLFDNLLALAEC